MLNALYYCSCIPGFLSRTDCRSVHICSCSSFPFEKCHYCCCGLADQWILGVLVQATGGNMVFLEHAMIACCEVVLKISIQFVVFFEIFPEEDV